MQKQFKYIISIAIIGILIYVVNQLNIFECCTPLEIKAHIESYGILAPIIYMIMFTLVPLTLFPDSILAIAGGMCFGLLWGSVYTMIGALLGGSLSFYLARKVGHKLFTKLQQYQVSQKIEEKGFIFILILRLMPLLPYDVISYGAGLSSVKYKDFILATMIGIIPGVLVFTNVGDKATDLGSSGFYISLSLVVIMFVVAGYLKKRFFSEGFKLNEKHKKSA